MAMSEAKQFEHMIKKIDRLPNDMPQDYKYRKKADTKAEGERAPVKLNKQPAVDSKLSSTVNNLVETNNKFQNTQNTIIQQQTELNKDQLQEDQQQTGIMQQQQQTMTQMNETMGKLYQLMKRQDEKLTPKFQERAAFKEVSKDLGKPQDAGTTQQGIGDMLGSALDLMGGKRGRGRGRGRNRRDRIRPNRQERADARLRRRAGGAAAGGGMIASAKGKVSQWRTSASEIAERLKNGGSGLFGSLRKAGQAAYAGAKGASGNKWVKASAGVLAGSAALLGGKELYDRSFGSVSEKYESGRRGVEAVSTGNGDHGGVSYGKFQLATNNGSMKKFLKSSQAEKFAPYFEGLTPGSAEFTSVYKKLAAEQPELMASAQQNYIQETHYDPAMRKLQANGLDFSERSRALNELVFSSATQYGAGGAPSKIMRALQGMDVSKMTDADIISVIQDNKSENVGTDFVSSSRNTQESVAARAQREKIDLLAMLKAEEDEKAGIDRAEVDRIRGTEKKEETAEATAEATVTNVEPVTTPTAPIGVLPMEAPNVGGAAAAGGGLLAGAAAVTMARKSGATPINPTVTGREAINPTVPENETRAARALREGKSAGVKAVSGPVIPKGVVGKIIPGVGIVMTATEAADIITDESLSTKEKARAGTKLAGGTAGAIAGGQAGAMTGSAVGAGIGSFFFGAGAVPGAAIGGIVGGVGGSIAGYFGGEYAAETGFDAVDGAINPATAKPVSQPLSLTETPSPLLTMGKAPAPVANPKLTAEKTVALTQNKPQAVNLETGKTTLMVVPVPMAAKVETTPKASNIASAPVKQEPTAQTASPAPLMINRGAESVPMPAQPAAQASVANAPSYGSLVAFNQAPVQPQYQSSFADSTPAPTVQVTPEPKRTAASWSVLPQATPQRVQEVTASHETPLARESYTSVQPVNVENQAPPPMANAGAERIKSSGVAESSSIRPELKDVPPMIADFGIVFLNAGII